VEKGGDVILKKKHVLTIMSVAVFSFLIGTTFSTNLKVLASEDNGIPFGRVWEAIYDLQSRVTSLEESINAKAWHFVMNFTANENGNISPKFHIEGEKWRIKWNFLTVEREFWGITYFVIEWGRGDWTGLIVYDDNQSVHLAEDIPIRVIGRDLDSMLHWMGETEGIGFLDEPSFKGIHYLFGEGEFNVAVKGVLTPVVLTIESYH
jgi:hypothetical protein